MASNRTSGNLLGLQINNEFIACEMSCEFNFETEMLSASPIHTGRWEDSIPGVRSWSISLNAGLLMRMVGSGLPNVINAFMTGEMMAIAFRTKLNDYLPNLVITGNVLVQSGNISSSVNSLASWNVTLKGCGAFRTEINTNVYYVIGTGEQSEVIQDGNGLMVGGQGGQVIGTDITPITPIIPDYGSGGTPEYVKNYNTASGNEKIRFATFTAEEFDNIGDLPDDLISIIE